MDNKELIKQLEEVVALHNKMRQAYYYASPRYAAKRRSYELQNSKVTSFVYNGNSYCISQETVCSCANVYYKVSYYINDEYVKSDIRLVYKILNELKSKK